MPEKILKITRDIAMFAKSRRFQVAGLPLRSIFAGCICVALVIGRCDARPEYAVSARQPSSGHHGQPAGRASIDAAHTLIAASRARIPLGEIYDPSYYSIPYPGGDVPNDRGVCTDVVIRAYRKLGIDFQKIIHEDMASNFSAYPKLWNMRSTDKNIDHRRVPNIETFLRRKGAALSNSAQGADYRAGDLVTWRLPGGQPHIGIVSDRYAPSSERPLILHNIGAGTVEDDILFRYSIHGHFRYFPSGG